MRRQLIAPENPLFRFLVVSTPTAVSNGTDAYATESPSEAVSTDEGLYIPFSLNIREVIYTLLHLSIICHDAMFELITHMHEQLRLL